MSQMQHDHEQHDHEHGEHESHRSPAPVQTASGSVFTQMSRGLGVSLGVAVLALLVVVTVGLYKFQWSNPLTDAVVHALPYPAAMVNGSIVRYSEYVDDLATVNRFFAKQIEQGLVDAAPSNEELRAGVLDRLIQTEVLRQEASRLALVVSDEDIENEYAKISAGGDGEAEAQILDLYGWSASQFKEKVLVPYLLQVKIAEAIATDDALSSAAKQRADEALAKVQGGDDFSAVAQEYSADPGSAGQGGDLGWFGKGVMVPEFETAAFALEPGATSGLVRTQFGWHIIRTDEVKKDDSGAVVEVKARHILVPGPDVAEYLKEKLDAADVKRLVNI